MIYGFEDVRNISMKDWLDMDHLGEGYELLDIEIVSNNTEEEYEVDEKTSEEED
jgi:hypothetical protein